MRGKPAGKKWNKGKAAKPLRPSLALGYLPCKGRLSRGQSPRRRLPIRGSRPSLRGLRGFLRGHYSTSSTQNPCKYTRGGCIGPIPVHPHRAAASAAGWGRVPVAPLRRTAPRQRSHTARSGAKARAGRLASARGCRPARPAQRCHPGAAAAPRPGPRCAAPRAKTSAPRPAKARGARRRAAGHLCRRNTATRRGRRPAPARRHTARPILRSAPAHGRAGAQSGPRQSTPAAARGIISAPAGRSRCQRPPRVGPKNGITLTSPHPVQNLPLVCPNRPPNRAGNGWDFKISVDFLKNRVKRITDPLAEL